MDILNKLSKAEKAQIIDAIPMITVLIAGADNEIDQEEKDWAAKLTKIRSFANSDLLHDFYQEVGIGFEEKIDKLINTLPKDTDDRNNQISESLSLLNPILAKLDSKIAYSLYKDFKSFAEHVAKASGGFLRIGSISKEEKRLIPLHMLDAIEYEEEE